MRKTLWSTGALGSRDSAVFYHCRVEKQKWEAQNIDWNNNQRFLWWTDKDRSFRLFSMCVMCQEIQQGCVLHRPVITVPSVCISGHQSVFHIYFRSHFWLCTFFHITAGFIEKSNFMAGWWGSIVSVDECCVCGQKLSAEMQCRQLHLSTYMWGRETMSTHCTFQSLRSRLHFCNFSLFLSTEVLCSSNNNNTLFIF